jgi:hypothetical protein
MNTELFHPNRASERGASLLVVTFVMVLILVGGLAAVALTSSELSGARGYRTRAVTEDCAIQAARRLQAMATDVTNPPTFANTSGSIGLGTTTGSNPTYSFNYAVGHYDDPGVDGTNQADGSPKSTLRLVSASSMDMAAFCEGTNVSNILCGNGSGGAGVVAATATCKGSGFGEREVEVIFQTGTSIVR